MSADRKRSIEGKPSVASETVWIGVAGVLLIVGAALALRRPAAIENVKPAPRAAPLPPPPMPAAAEFAAPRIVADPGEIKAASMTAEERILLLDEQVRRLREYAAQYGPDDPFSLTEEQIEAFRKAGDPIVW